MEEFIPERESAEYDEIERENNWERLKPKETIAPITIPFFQTFYEQALRHAQGVARIHKLFASKEVQKVLDEVIADIETLKPK